MVSSLSSTIFTSEFGIERDEAQEKYLWEGTNVPEKSESKSASHGLIISGRSRVSPNRPMSGPSYLEWGSF